MDKRPSSKVIGKINEFIYCYCINTQVKFLNSTNFQVYTQQDYNLAQIFKVEMLVASLVIKRSGT